jgi:DNA gyrase/topoisomerase IV subunit A|tara:strand:+ start:476 stop:1786 length:1311 start_codon:yes stop_codon:yes gene_type:complete
MEYSLSEMANNEIKGFALYTIESRAIPSICDGMKPVQRFYLYSSLVNTAKDFKKVSAVSGIVSDYGYNHGEASAAGAGQLMAATWNNNVCLIEGRGSFGTRQVPQAGAARYVYTRLHPNFNKYVKDIDLVLQHEDPEHIPPKFYMPVIPLVLANGTKGIATGFATNILPRSTKDLINACKEYITTGKIKKNLPIIFPDFKGKTVAMLDNQYDCYGIVKRVNSNTVAISEIPYGTDRETYVKILDKLESENKISGFEDQCSSDGFTFEVRFKRADLAKLKEDQLIALLKLKKSHTENLNVIDWNGTLRQYDDHKQLIIDFIEYRMANFVKRRIELRKAETSEAYRWLTVKKEFVSAVLDEVIKFKGRKKADVTKQILTETFATESDADRLLKMNIMSLTAEMVKALKEQIKAAQDELKYWKGTNEAEQFNLDLQELS